MPNPATGILARGLLRQRIETLAKAFDDQRKQIARGTLPTAASMEAFVTPFADLRVAVQEAEEQTRQLLVARESFAAEHRRYLELFTHAPVGCLVTDARGTIREANPAAGSLLRIAPEALVGERLATLVARADRQAFTGRLRRLLKRDAADVKRWVIEVQPHEGEPIPVVAIVGVTRDERGRRIGLRVLLQDVSERRRSERELQDALRELEEFKYALDQASIVAVTDQKGAIQYVNEKFCEISKYAPEELLGQDHRILNSRFHPKEFIRGLWHTIANRRVWRGEIRNRAKDGSLYWVDTTIVPLLDARNKPSRYLAIRTDVTENKKAQEALLKNQSSAALARLGEMAAVVAHEVRNPLAGIAGAIQVVGDRLPEGSLDRDALSNVLGRVGDLNQMIQDFLAFARPRPPRRGPVPLLPLLREAAASLTDDAEYSGVKVEVSGAEVTVSGDADLLRGAFANLLLNAGQAMSGQGAIRVSIRGMDGQCLVTVHDEGPGVPVEARQRVFEPFFTTKHRGTGLGLAVVRRDVEAHGGEIAISCPPGGGTLVLVTLPVDGP